MAIYNEHSILETYGYGPYGLEQFILADLEEKRLTGKEQELYLSYDSILRSLGGKAKEPGDAQHWATVFVDAHMLLSSPRGNGIWFAAIFD